MNLYEIIAPVLDYKLIKSELLDSRQALSMRTEDGRGFISVADTIGAGWETAIYIHYGGEYGIWLIKEGKFDGVMQHATTLEVAIRILFSLDAPWSANSTGEEYFHPQHIGFESVESMVLDHIVLKKSIERWEEEIDKIIEKNDDNEELVEALDNISGEMMSFNI